MLDGLRRFWRDKRVAPTSTRQYQKLQQFTPGTRQSGVGNVYPSSYGVLRYFRTFRQAWQAAGIAMNRSEEEWTPEEIWFLTEGAGLLSRVELAQALQRTPNAVHRKLYDLGIHSYRQHGWTVKRMADAMGVCDTTLYRYMRDGRLPYVRGSKCYFLDPADCVVVQEADWNKVPLELEQAVRRSLMTRLVKILVAMEDECRTKHLLSGQISQATPSAQSAKTTKK